MNREIRRIERDGGVQRTIYDRNGQVVRLIRPNEYDAQTDGGEGFQFTYDAQGRVLTVLSPEGQVLQTNAYDVSGRLLQRLDGMGGGVKYEYDLAGDQRQNVQAEVSNHWKETKLCLAHTLRGDSKENQHDRSFCRKPHPAL